MQDRESILDTPRAEAWLIAALLVVTLTLRLSNLGGHWIDPDEGAHLMDALLVHRGYVPEVDFVARQPLYVYVLAGFFWLTGVSLEAGRFFPVICSLLVGLPLYALSRDLFGRGSALLALATWWMLPLEIRASSVVKTEPFAILLAVSCVFAAVRAVRSSSWAWMLGAGMLGAAGFYVRESALVIPPAILLYVAWENRGRLGPTTRSFGTFVAGYLLVCLAAGLFYSHWVGTSAFVRFTPVHFVLGSLESAVATLPQASVGELADASYAYGESAAEYLQSVKDGVFYLLFLIAAGGFAGLYWLAGLFRRDDPETDPGTSTRQAGLALVLAWAVLLGLAYAWHFSQRGFWFDYSREFIAPLILALVGWLTAVVPSLRRRGPVIRLIIGAIVVGWLWMLFQDRFPSFYGIGHHATLGAVLFLLFWHLRDFDDGRRYVYALGMTAMAALIVGARYTPIAGLISGSRGSLLTLVGATLFAAVMIWKANGRPAAVLLRSLPLALVAGSLVVCLSYSALRFRYKQGIWSPEAVAEVTGYLTETTAPEDRVMSGGVVWELNAHRLPWGLYSHPMVIQRVLPAEESRALTEAFKADPPEVIVMDGITERTFGPNVQQLDAILATYYELVMEPEPVTFDVKVYRRIRPDARP